MHRRPSAVCKWATIPVWSGIVAHSTISHDYDAADTLVVSDPAQLRALSDEVRGRIIALLRERAASASELGGLLEMPKGTVGHHLKVLERAGLVHVVRTRRVRAVTEKLLRPRGAALPLQEQRRERRRARARHRRHVAPGGRSRGRRSPGGRHARPAARSARAPPRPSVSTAGSTSSSTTCRLPRRPTASPGASRPPSTGRLVADAPAGRALAAPRLPQPLGGGDDQPVFGSQIDDLALGSSRSSCSMRARSQCQRSS